MIRDLPDLELTRCYGHLSSRPTRVVNLEFRSRISQTLSSITPDVERFFASRDPGSKVIVSGRSLAGMTVSKVVPSAFATSRLLSKRLSFHIQMPNASVG